MDIRKKLTKIFEAPEPDDFNDDIEQDEAEADVEPIPGPINQENDESVEEKPEISGAGAEKRERTGADAGLRNWFGIPEAKPGRTLDDLKSLDWRSGITPEKAGWTFDEVLAAMKPSIMDKANYVSSSNPNISKDEAAAAGAEAIWNTWKKDAAKSAFPTYAFRWIDTAMRRAAAAANVMKSGGQATYGGQLDWRGLKGQQTLSADVEDAGGEAYSANIPAEETAANTAAGSANAIIHKLIDLPAVELTETEKAVLRMTYGIKKDGTAMKFMIKKKVFQKDKKGKVMKDENGEPISSEIEEPTRYAPTSEIARLISTKGTPVSAARVSQIRASAQEKLTDYMSFKGISTVDNAKDKLNLESAARMLIAIIKESVDLEISMLSRYRKIPSDAMIEGKEIGINVIVDTHSMEVVDATDRFNESILAKVPSRNIEEAKKTALYTMSDAYFSDIMESIIKTMVESHFKHIVNREDPQQDVDAPQEFLDEADKIMQQRIETSVDEHHYANGDWTDRIYELAEELWAEAGQAKLEADADAHRDREKDALYDRIPQHFGRLSESAVGEETVIEGSRNRSPEYYKYPNTRSLRGVDTGVGMNDQDDNFKYSAVGGIEYAPQTPQVKSLIDKASDIKQVSEYAYSYIFDDLNDAQTFADLMGTSVEKHYASIDDERSDEVPFKNQ